MAELQISVGNDGSGGVRRRRPTPCRARIDSLRARKADIAPRTLVDITTRGSVFGFAYGYSDISRGDEIRGIPRVQLAGSLALGEIVKLVIAPVGESQYERETGDPRNQ